MAEHGAHRIFISYRRSDTGLAAGALARDLRRIFGESRVFRDREDVQGGTSWRSQLREAIAPDSVVLVVIDQQWLVPASPTGQPRLFASADPVRQELLDALRAGARIIPILLEDATMPDADSLPPELRTISEIGALPLRDTDWPHDLSRICRTVERAGFSPTSSGRAFVQRALTVPRGIAKRSLLLGMAVAAIATLSIAGRWLWHRLPVRDVPEVVTTAQPSTVGSSSATVVELRRAVHEAQGAKADVVVETKPPQAEGLPALSDTLTSEAKENYYAGRILLDIDDYAGALIKFRKAFELSGDPRLLWNCALCETRLHHYASALGLLEDYAQAVRGRLVGAERAELDETMRALGPLVTRVNVVVNESGARVYVDEEFRGESPLRGALLIDMGRHVFQVRKPGFYDLNMTRDFDGGAELTMNVFLLSQSVATQ